MMKYPLPLVFFLAAVWGAVGSSIGIAIGGVYNNFGLFATIITVLLLMFIGSLLIEEANNEVAQRVPY